MKTFLILGRLVTLIALGFAGRAYGQVGADPVFAAPDMQNVTEGRNMRFSVIGTPDTVQWQVSADGGGVYTDLAESSVYVGTMTRTLELVGVTSAMGNFRFRVTFTKAGLTGHSNPCWLTVSPALFPMPSGLATDNRGNLYISDEMTHTVYWGVIVPIDLRPNGLPLHLTLSALAGKTGETGSADGTGAGAFFNHPAGVAVSPAGVVALADSANGTIRQISATGVVTTLAGDSVSRGNVDGMGVAARFSAPVGIARASDGSYYVADSTNHTIRKVTADGTVTTFAGSPGNAGSADGAGSTARFNHPEGVAVDNNGVVYVADTANNLIRTIAPNGVVGTLAGVPGVVGAQDGAPGQATFNAPAGIAASSDGGLIFVADTGNSTIRVLLKSLDYQVQTFAGTPMVSGLGDGDTELLDHPKSVAVDSSTDYYLVHVYFTDTGNAAIRVASWVDGLQTFMLGTGLSANPPPPVTPPPSKPRVPTTTPAPVSSASSSGGGAFDGRFIAVMAGLWLLRRRAVTRRRATG